MSDPSRRRRIAGEARPGSPRSSAAKRRPALSPRRKRPNAQTGRGGSKVQLGVKRTSRTPENSTGSPQSDTQKKGDTEKTSRRARLRQSVSRRDLGIMTVALLVAVLGVGFGLWKHALIPGISSNASQEAHQQAATRASEGAVTVFSFDYETLDEHLAESKKLMTSSFGKEFEEIAPALHKLAPENEIRVEATTQEFAPVECGDECSPNKASVLVFLDQAKAQGSSEPDVFANRILVDMVKQDGRWLIDDIRNL